MKNISLKDIAKSFLKFDWGYSSSSDINEWKNGESEKRKVKKLVQTYLSKNPTHSNMIEKLSDKIQETKFSVLPFNSKIWTDKNFDQISINESLLNENVKLKEGKFYAFWKNKKHTINGKSLYDAKQKAITKLKIPKSKVGLLAVVNAGEHDRGSFKFEGKLNEGQEPFWTDKDSVKDAIKQIKKGLKNTVPYLDGIHYSTLGGEPNIVGKISLDKKKDWTNGILENSRWALIYLSPNGVLDTIRMNGYSDFKTRKKVPILRKSKNKNLKQAIDRMGRYFTVVRTKHPDTK